MKRLMQKYQALCTMGLPTSDVVPLALNLLEQALGGNYLGFAWVNEQLEISGVCWFTPVNRSALEYYYQEFHNRRETEIIPGFKFSLTHKIPIVNSSHRGASFYQSALYNEYASVIGVHKIIRLNVIDYDRRYGVLLSGRSHTERPYTEQEENLCLWAARLLAQAFELERVKKLIDTDTIEDGMDGYLLADDTGRILHGSGLGLRWLQDVARFPASGISAAGQIPAPWLNEARLKGAGGEITIATGPGPFVLRPLKLNGIKEADSPVYVITVKRRGSKAALIWRETDKFHLSGREKQVAVLLGSGYSNDDIAHRLSIGSTTVITYIKRVFEKLGIDKREQLLRAIL